MPTSPLPTDGSSVVIVGASLAGVRTAEALEAEGFTGSITLVGDEPHRPYDRPPLSKGYLAGTTPPEQLLLDQDLVEGEGSGTGRFRWRLGSAATSLDTTRRTVGLADGSREPYDTLVIATGAAPIVPAGLDLSLSGVHLMRGLDDAAGLRRQLERGVRRVAVIGAGFIGAEIASTCRSLGVAVTLVDLAEVPLDRPLGRQVAGRLMHLHRQAGTDFRLGVGAAALLSDGRDHAVSGVLCTDGSVVEADAVVVAIGVRPSTQWLESSGIALADGVLCHPDLASVGNPDVYAVGDVARWTHPLVEASVRVEHWSNASEGAQVVAERIMGRPARHDAVPSFWSDQLGVKIQGVGFTSLADEVVVDDTDGTLFATYHRAGALVGAVAFGAPRRLVPVRRQLGRELSATS